MKQMNKYITIVLLTLLFCSGCGLNPYPHDIRIVGNEYNNCIDGLPETMASEPNLRIRFEIKCKFSSIVIRTTSKDTIEYDRDGNSFSFWMPNKDIFIEIFRELKSNDNKSTETPKIPYSETIQKLLDTASETGEVPDTNIVDANCKVYIMSSDGQMQLDIVNYSDYISRIAVSALRVKIVLPNMMEVSNGKIQKFYVTQSI